MKSHNGHGEKALVKSSNAKGFDREQISQLAMENPFFTIHVQGRLSFF